MKKAHKAKFSPLSLKAQYITEHYRQNNIIKQFNILVQVRFTASKAILISGKISFLYELLRGLPNDLSFRILSNQEISGNTKTGYWQSLVPSFPSRRKALAVALNITQEQISKFSFPFLFCLIFLPYSFNFFRDCTCLWI